ncbi:hypothetical protein [Aquiflexum lacus]|uniref:hypothetical protein n=1 Tax=Aquiflexum lacus TaxID=2483805 RepID=UPI0018948F34|nr:hypothetical protein [Aquiflexum lacus]
MKKLTTEISKIAVVSGLIVFGLFGCAHPNAKDIDSNENDRTEVGNETTHDMNSNSESTMSSTGLQQDYDTYASEIDERFNRNTETLNEMTKNLESGVNAGQTEINQELYELNKRNLEIQTKVKNQKNQGSESWDDFKESVNNEMNELEKSIKTLGEKDS